MNSVRKDILRQVWVAFGQGAGSLPISTEAVRVLTNRYRHRITPQVIAYWDSEGGQVLERLRAVGRSAAEICVRSGAPELSSEFLNEAANRVEKVSSTMFCKGDPQDPDFNLGIPRSEAVAVLMVAFGQGTGPVRVPRTAARAMAEIADRQLEGVDLTRWDRLHVELIEQARAVGRLAALRAAQASRTYVVADEVTSAGETVFAREAEEVRHAA